MSILFEAVTIFILYRLLAIGHHRHVLAVSLVVSDASAMLEHSGAHTGLGC